MTGSVLGWAGSLLAGYTRPSQGIPLKLQTHPLIADGAEEFKLNSQTLRSDPGLSISARTICGLRVLRRTFDQQNLGGSELLWLWPPLGANPAPG